MGIFSSISNPLKGLFGGGQKGGVEQAPTLTPEQQQFMQMLLSQAQPGMESGFSYLQQLLSDDPEAISAFEAPAMRQFEEQIVPGIAERFAGAGALGSSAFGQQLGAAGAGLSENLAALRAGLKEQAIGQLGGLSGLGLGQQFENVYRPADKGFMGNLLGNFAGGFGGSMGGKLFQ